MKKSSCKPVFELIDLIQRAQCQAARGTQAIAVVDDAVNKDKAVAAQKKAVAQDSY